MAYQPIQHRGYGGGDERRSARIAEFNRLQRQQVGDEIEQERYEADKKRQAQFDFQQAYQTAANLAERGDIAGAQALLAQYSPQFQDRDAEAKALKGELGIDSEPKRPLTSNYYAGQQPQGGSAVPDGMDGGRSMAGSPEASPDQMRALKFMQMIGRAPADADPTAVFAKQQGRAEDEPAFQKWYGDTAKKVGWSPNPDAPEHHYDYRAMYRDNIAGEGAAPTEAGEHGSSQYKLPGHPREFLADRSGRVFNTKTGLYTDGTPVSPQELQAAGNAPDLTPAQLQAATAPAPLPQGPSVDQLMQQATGGAPQDAQLNPILAGFGKDRERQQAMARRLLSFTAPSGQRIDMDVDARKNFQLQQQDQERARNAQLAQEAFAETEDPKIMFFNLVKSGLDVKTAGNMVGDMVEKRQAAKAAATAKAEAEARANTEWERRNSITSKQMDRRAVLGAGRPLTLAQSADDARANSAAASALLTQELAKEDYKEQRKALGDSEKLAEQLSSDNPAAQRAALGTWAKLAAGPGTVQASERDEFVNLVGGKGMQAQRWANEWLNGGRVPEEQKRIFEEAVKDIVISGYKKRLGNIQKGVRSAYETHPLPQMRAYADWAADRVAPGVLPSSAGANKTPLNARDLAREILNGK